LYLRDGPVKIYGANGRIKGEGMIRDHTTKDNWIEYFDYGQVHKLFNFKSDTGWETTYYENGNVQDSSFRTKNDLYIVKAWYEDGQLKSEVGWKNYQFFGEQSHFYESGQVKERFQIVKGKPDGKMIEFLKWASEGIRESEKR
jgi:antitoxin component YwqK of YwqJK toxin-antitoxin module